MPRFRYSLLLGAACIVSSVSASIAIIRLHSPVVLSMTKQAPSVGTESRGNSGQAGATTINFPTASSISEEEAFYGTNQRPIDYSDPLLKQRMIVSVTNMSPQSTVEIVSKLLYLNADSPTQPITLFLRTNGGTYNDAFAVIETMHSITAPVNVTAMGCCWSAGALILASGTGKRTASADTEIMVHANVEPKAKSETEDSLDRDRIERLYRAKTHLPSNWYPLSGDRHIFLTAAQAKQYGIIDEIK